MIYIMYTLFAFGFTFITTAPLFLKMGMFKGFYHDVLKWHQPDDSPKWTDGCSLHSVCKHCGKEIMQDSQGNWFVK